jgi:hypothetical protein
MIDNDSLKQAFGALERHTPDQTTVLAGVYEGIRHRRRRRQVASVAGVATAAALVAIGVVFVAPGQGGGQDGPAQAITPAAPKTAKPEPAAPAPELPFTVGWVPQGYALNAWEVSDASSSAQYVGPSDFETVVVWVSDEQREAPQDATDEPATIAGRPGTIRKLAPDGAETQLIWQLADGSWAMVGGRTPTVTEEELHQVAQSLTAQPTTLEVTLDLRGLPEGYQVAGWSGSGGDGSALLCKGEAQPRGREFAKDCVNVEMRSGKAPASVEKPIVKSAKEKVSPGMVAVDQEQVVNGVTTRATADGVLAIAQVDPEHWVRAFSQAAGVEVLRETASLATVR